MDSSDTGDQRGEETDINRINDDNTSSHSNEGEDVSAVVVEDARTSTPKEQRSWVVDMDSEMDSSATGEDLVLQVRVSSQDREGMQVDEDSDSRVRVNNEAEVNAASNPPAPTSSESSSTGSSWTGEELTNVARNRMVRDRYYRVINVDNSGTTDIGPRGTLSTVGDGRYRWTQQWTDRDRFMNISSSFDLRTFRCTACGTGHQMHDDSGKAVIIITDQMFAPAVPTVGGGNCMGIIRIEDATFTELAAFLKEHVVHNLRSGSVVLVAAGTQLARCGVSAYCADLTAVVGDLTRSLPRGCKVSHCPLFFTAGTADKPWLDAVRDLTSWLERGASIDSGTGTLYLTELHKKMLEAIESNEVDERASLSTAARVVMPATLSDRTSTVFQIGGKLMPDKIVGFSYEQQSEILLAMICELLDKTEVRPSAAIKYRYVEEVPVPASAAVPVQYRPIWIVIGAGHASRLRISAVNSGIDARYIPMRKITAVVIAEARKRLLELVENLDGEARKNTTVVFMAMDGQAFTSYNDATEPAAAAEGEGEECHFPGFMTAVPEMAFRRLIDIAMPVLEVDPQVATVIVMPLPKYFNGKGCCADRGHVTNVRDPNFKADMLRAMAVGKNAINRAMVSGGHHLVRAVNVAPMLADQLSSTLSGEEGESEINPGYLLLEQYSVVVEEVQKTAKATRDKRAQYEGRDRDTIYNRNTQEHRTGSGIRSGGLGAGTGSNTRNRPYDIVPAAEIRSRHRSDTSTLPDRVGDDRGRQRHRSDPNATDYSRTMDSGTGISESGTGSNIRVEQPPRFGARDIRYMSEEELEADRREREASRASAGHRGLTGTASRRGRGGLYNLGRFTKKF